MSLVFCDARDTSPRITWIVFLTVLLRGEHFAVATISAQAGDASFSLGINPFTVRPLPPRSCVPLATGAAPNILGA